jgi:hypothetical protein
MVAVMLQALQGVVHVLISLLGHEGIPRPLRTLSHILVTLVCLGELGWFACTYKEPPCISRVFIRSEYTVVCTRF